MRKTFFPIRVGSLIVALAFVLNGCYVTTKTLENDVHVRIISPNSITRIDDGNPEFLSKATDSQLLEEFRNGLASEFSGNRVIIDDLNPEFEIVINEIRITESRKNDTIHDADSDDNGKVFVLSSLDLTANGTMRRLSDGSVENWSADKSNDEKTTSSRSVGQMVSGSNQERNVYREKEFNSTEAADLTSNLGRRSGVMIIKDLVRILQPK